MKVYISGKMRGLPEEESRRRFEAARQYLIELGHDVVNPWDSEKEKEAQCLEWEDYILYDLRIIKHCDALFMLDNWRDSDGAKCEHAFASGRKMEILYETHESDDNDLQKASEEYADERLSVIRPDISDSSYSRKTKMTLDLFEGYELEAAFEEGANWQKKRSNDSDFCNGIWCCVQDLVVVYIEPTIAKDILRSSGMSIEQMRKAQETSGSYDEQMYSFINSIENNY